MLELTSWRYLIPLFSTCSEGRESRIFGLSLQTTCMSHYDFPVLAIVGMVRDRNV